jgi:hypothetical protein
MEEFKGRIIITCASINLDRLKGRKSVGVILSLYFVVEFNDHVLVSNWTDLKVENPMAWYSLLVLCCRVQRSAVLLLQRNLEIVSDKMMNNENDFIPTT